MKSLFLLAFFWFMGPTSGPLLILYHKQSLHTSKKIAFNLLKRLNKFGPKNKANNCSEKKEKRTREGGCVWVVMVGVSIYSGPTEARSRSPRSRTKKTRANPCFSEQFILSHAASCKSRNLPTISSPTM